MGVIVAVGCLAHKWARPERSNFGTDLYMVEGLARLLGGRHRLRLVDGAAGVAALLEDSGGSVAAVVLTHVCYRTGRMLDMAGLTRLAHQQCAAALTPQSYPTLPSLAGQVLVTRP